MSDAGVALGLAVVALLMVAGILVAVVIAERGQSADRCSACPHLRWDHRAEGCQRCSCPGFAP